MDVITIILFAVILCMSVVSLLVHGERRARAHRAKKDFFAEAKPVRTLRGNEREALRRAYKVEPLDDQVYVLEGKATRHGFSSRHTTDWHLLIDGVEIRFFPHWQLWLEESNRVEVVRTQRKLVARGSGVLPLTFNGITLAEALEHRDDDKAVEIRLAEIDTGNSRRMTVGVSGEEGRSGEALPDVKRVGTHKETPEQARLRQANKQKGAGMSLLLCLGLLGLTLSALIPGTAQQWVAGIPCLILVLVSAWFLRATPDATPDEIRSLRGPLGMRRRSVGKEDDPTLVTEFCIGDKAVHYPDLWRAVMFDHPEATHRVDIDSKDQVVRHDRLDLYEQLRRFPVPQVGRYWAQLLGAIVVLVVALWVGASAGASIPATFSRLLGQTQQINARTPAALLDANPQPGDWVELAGTGMCIGGTADADRASLEGLPRHDVPTCRMLAWTADATTAGSVELPPAVQSLAQLSNRLGQAGSRMSTQLANKPRVRALMALFTRVPVGHVNARVEDVDVLCEKLPHDARPCYAVQAAFQKLTGHSGAWDEVVDLARRGKLEDRMAISARDAHILAKRLDRAMKPSYLDAQFSLLQTARARQSVSLFLLDQGGNRWSHAPEHRDVLDSLDEADAGLEASVDAMMAWPFTITGALREVGKHDGKPVFMIQRMESPTSVYTLAVPRLLALFGLLMLLLAAINLYFGRKARARRTGDVAEYVAGNLK